MKMTINRGILVGVTLAWLSVAAGPSLANNVVVTNTILTAPAAGKVAVRFDLAWENSWRDDVTKFDACWVFVKYSIDAGATWSHATLDDATLSLTNSSTASEAPNRGNGNFWTCAPAGPYRVGSYANASSSRTNSGASFYGALDLSGNIWERMVTAGNTTGRSFTGLHGDGMLDVNGEADVSGWPGTSSEGAGQRGGAWDGTNTLARASDRSYAVYTSASRASSHGCRVVRAAP